MNYLRSCAAPVMTLLALSLIAACSSDPAEEAAQAPGSDGDGAQAAAATEFGGTGKMADTPEYKVAQEFPLTIEVSSSVFSRIRRIPIEFTCTDNYWYPETGEARYGEDKSPPLAWTAGPEGTVSYALIVDDPDAVKYDVGVISPRVHWVIWNIPAGNTELAEHVATTTEVAAVGPSARQGINDFGVTGWSGPCPPPNVISIFQRDDYVATKKTQYPHAYLFTVYALDAELDLAAGSNKNDLLAAMDGHILAAGQLSGEYINKKLYK